MGKGFDNKLIRSLMTPIIYQAEAVDLCRSLDKVTVNKPRELEEFFRAIRNNLYGVFIV